MVSKLIFQFHQVTIDTNRFLLSVSGRNVSVEPQVFNLLVYLIEHRDRVVSRDELFENLWAGKVVSDAALSARLKDARKAVGDSGNRQEVIRTVHGRGYQFVAEVALPVEDEFGSSAVVELLERPYRPSIAILPFSNLSNDPEQEYFSDGITEDIITELSRFPSLLVISRNSSFAFKRQAVNITEIGKKLSVQFIVEGSVRKAGDRIRITAQLIEVSTGSHVWAERYDRDLDSIFAVQDEVVSNIVTMVPGYIEITNRIQSGRKHPQDLKAYDLVLQAEKILYGNAGSREGEKLLKQALELDPGYARAQAGLAFFYTYSVFAHGRHFDEVIKSACKHAELALKLDPRDPVIHAALASAYSLLGKHDLSRYHCDKARALNPNDFYVVGLTIETEAYLGNYQEALKWANRALASDPYSADGFRESFFDAYFIGGEYQLALDQLVGWNDYPPNIYLAKAAALAHLGRYEEARETIRSLEKIRPDGWDVKEVMRAYERMCANPRHGERWIEGFRQAGLEV